QDVVDAVHPVEHRHVSRDQRGGVRERRPRAAGVALVPRWQDRLATWPEQVVRRCSGPRAPRDVSHVDDEDEHPANLMASHVGSPPVSFMNHRMQACPTSTPSPYIIGQAPAITLMSWSRQYSTAS